jgi:hypothetical protein
MSKPNRYKKCEADVLKNLFKATRFYFNSRDRTFNVLCILKKGWLARLKGHKVLLEKLFQHICLTN